MNRQSIRIARADDAFQEVTADVWGEVAIHRTLSDEKDAKQLPWTVTHVRTGYRIAAFRTEGRAQKLVSKLLELPIEMFQFHDVATSSERIKTISRVVQRFYQRAK